MITLVKGRGKWLPVLAGVLLGCLAAPGRGDELQYAPDGATIVMSMDIQKLFKSKAYEELKAELKKLKIKEDVDFIKTKLGDQMGVPAGNLARVTMTVAFKSADKGREEELGIITTLKPVTAAGIKMTKKAPKYKANVTYKETKVGAFTVYEENFQYQFNPTAKPDDKVQTGEAFCVVDGKTVLFGPRLEALKKVLERNKAADLSATMKAGLKQAGSANAMSIVIDIQNMPAREKAGMLKGLPAPGLKEMIDNVQVFAGSLNETGSKVKGMATVMCSDAASAAKIKKIADDGIAELKAKVKNDPKIPKLPPQVQEMSKAALEILGAIQISAKGNYATAEGTVESTTIVKVMTSIFVLLAPRPTLPDKTEPREIKKPVEKR